MKKKETERNMTAWLRKQDLEKACVRSSIHLTNINVFYVSGLLSSNRGLFAFQD
jgi:hypothetical protein